MVAVILDVNRPIWGVLMSLFLIPISGCDRLHEPAVYNALDSVVEVRVAWEDGRVSSGTVSPQEVVHLGRVDSTVREVTVLRHGEIFAALTGARMEELATEVGEDLAGVVIEEGGVRALTKAELKSIYGR